MSIEIESIAALHAQELAVHAGMVAIIRSHDFAVADAECRFTAVRTMRTDRGGMPHLTGPRLITIGSTGQRADRANIDARSAFVTFEMIAAVGHDLRSHSAIPDTQRIYTQTLAANTNTAVTENTARRIVKDDGRPLFLIHMDFRVDEPALARAIAKDHILQFAFAAFVAHRAIQGVVGQQKFQHAFASLPDLRRIRVYHHAFGDGQRARNL